ncbi:ATP-binding cassette domain-containing protein [Glutamicibacter sp. NPDC087344]|uniref:ATP-binding cassette domain-containing protein n=1 Tax=Glutamicibacter sp. NPDC087344 TaxID=3363994 RepID=UPI00380BFBA0
METNKPLQAPQSISKAGTMITLDELSKSYSGKTAVDRFSAQIRPGAVTGFLGPNGAGKSTTMRLILGLDRPDSGEAFINGKAYRHLVEPLRHVGAHITANAGFPGQTPRSFLKVLARSNRLPAQRVEQVLEQAGLQQVATQRIRGFSLGMRQRLGIAAALLGQPPVLVLDEPMNGLDAEGIRWIRGLMRQHAQDDGTVLVSSHLLSEVQQVADELLVIGRGRLITQASTEELLRGQEGPRIAVRSPQAPLLAQILRAQGAAATERGDGLLEITGMSLAQVGAVAYRSNIEVHELSAATGSLETVYTELTAQAVEYATANRKENSK